MRHLIRSIGLLALTCAAPVLGQTPPDPAARRDPPRGYVYAFFAPGAASGDGHTAGFYHLGGGGEGFITRRVSLAGEAGFLGPFQRNGGGAGLLSVNGSYHFVDADRLRQVIPFVTGGYSFLFASGLAHAVNFGGGVQYWFHRRWGLRAEFRDHVSPQFPGVHVWQGRIAVMIR